MKTEFTRARDAMSIWRSNAMIEYSVALVSAGLSLLDSGMPYFGTDDVAEEYQPDDKGKLQGCAVKQLLAGNILRRFFGFDPEHGVYGGRRKSSRGSRHGAEIALYQLTNRGIAEEFCRRHGGVVAKKQMEIEFA